MEDQLSQIIQEKILLALEAPLPVFTRRDARCPALFGKAMAVIGMRRAGKTTFLHQMRAERIAAGRNPQCQVYFNFEDERLGGLEAGQLSLIPQAHLRLFPEPSHEPVTLYLDEIQTVAGWEKFVRRLLDEGAHEVFLSGSSAKLLSREIATSMRGRSWEVAIHPFSFAEWMRHHGHELPHDPARLTSRRAAMLDRHFREYLETGGFPEAQGLPLAARRQLFQNHVDVLLLRDVIERHNVANVTALRWMVRRLLGNPAGPFSVTKFDADLKSQGIPAGRETLYEMLGHLEDTFLLRAIPVATDSEKRRQVNPRKVYPVDHALAPVFDRSAKANTGHALEVAVYNELQRRGAEVGYVKTNSGHEVDFLSLGMDGARCLIQVCESVDDPGTLMRETRALVEASEELRCKNLLLLTGASRMPFPEVPGPIRILPAWQWMLESGAI
jgi:predicted AAA+ superfamily ATPase